MSQVRTMTTAITDAELLRRACDRMRTAGFKIQGPRYEKTYPGRTYGQTREAYLVRFQNAYRENVFYCDEEGTAQIDRDAAYGGKASDLYRLELEYNAAGVERFAETVGGHLEGVAVSDDQREMVFDLVY